jgi:hypothetical protein
MQFLLLCRSKSNLLGVVLELLPNGRFIRHRFHHLDLLGFAQLLLGNQFDAGGLVVLMQIITTSVCVAHALNPAISGQAFGIPTVLFIFFMKNQ